MKYAFVSTNLTIVLRILGRIVAATMMFVTAGQKTVPLEALADLGKKLRRRLPHRRLWSNHHKNLAKILFSKKSPVSLRLDSFLLGYATKVIHSPLKILAFLGVGGVFDLWYNSKYIHNI
jgi:hypothetical protein